MRDFLGRIIRTDLLGRKISKKQIKREVIAENRERGKRGEENAKMKLTISGYEVERSPRGRDFIARKRNMFTGKVVKTMHVEVKTGNARLSDLQRKTKKKHRNYTIMRESGGFV